MTTQPTSNPVPSESPRDLKFNAGKIHEFVNSPERQYFDRFESPHYKVEGLRWLAQQSIAMFRYIPVDFFQMDASFTLPNQMLRDASSGEYYRWDGTLSKMVSAGSTPSTAGGVGIGKWLSVGAGVVGSYAEGACDALVAVKQPFNSAVGTTQHEFNSRQLYFADRGAKGYGVTDDSAAIQRACNEAPSGATISFGNGNYLFSNITLSKAVRIKGNGFQRGGTVFLNNSTTNPFFKATNTCNIKIDSFYAKTSITPTGGSWFQFTKCFRVEIESFS